MCAYTRRTVNLPCCAKTETTFTETNIEKTAQEGRLSAKAEVMPSPELSDPLPQNASLAKSGDDEKRSEHEKACR